jgi:hypothetical protein
MLFQYENIPGLVIVLSFFGTVVVTFLYVGLKTLRRNPSNRTNQIFALFFIMTSAALALNLPVPVLPDLTLRGMLVTISVYGTSVGMGLLLIFTLVLRYSNKIVTDRRKWVIFLVFLLAFIGYFFVPEGIDYVLGANSVYTIQWAVPFALYFLAGTQVAFVLIFWCAIKTSSSFGDDAVQRRFRKFLLGLVCLEVMLVTMPLVNAGWMPEWGLVFQVSAIPGAILVYLGVGKQL